MKYLSLFTGIGGFELGIQQAYEHKVSIPSSRPIRDSGSIVEWGNTGAVLDSPICIGYSEIDKYAIQIYQKHFPDHTNYGDITKIDPATLPDFDFLCGGFPCQAFSIAGKRKGFDDTRGTLFFDIARILRAKQPRLLLLENVKGLLSHDNGKTFSTIVSTLDELGYDLQWQVLNSKNHGVPQNRERVFIVGHLRGTPRPQVFPFGATDGKDIDAGGPHKENGGRFSQSEDGQEEVQCARNAHNESARDCTLYERGAPTIDQLNSPKHSNDRVYGADGISPTLNTMQGGLRQPFVKVPEATKIRRLTPTECERLQSFPDRWTEGVSDTQRYKTLGNAVTVNVIRDIISRLQALHI